MAFDLSRFTFVEGTLNCARGNIGAACSNSYYVNSGPPTIQQNIKRLKVDRSFNSEAVAASATPSVSSPVSSPVPSLVSPVPSVPSVSGGLNEKYASPNCSERALKLLIVGHNPSNKSWSQGHYYANPSNRMWGILRDSNIVPSSYTCRDDDRCPQSLGIGFTDVGYNHPETQSNKINGKVLKSWKQSFYRRLIEHVNRVAMTNLDVEYYPRVIVFAGITQYKALFPASYDFGDMKSTSGCIKPSVKPVDWPVELSKSIIFIMPSTSGAAAMSNEARERPWMQLGVYLKRWKWPDLLLQINEDVEAEVEKVKSDIKE